MKLYPEEWECALRFQRSQHVPRLSEEQLREARESGKRYTQWSHGHPFLHNLLNSLVFAALFIADISLLVILAPWLLGPAPTAAQWLLAFLIVSVVHGFLFYSVTIFSIHEGAAHDRIIQSVGPVSRFFALLANNASRVFYADPIYYRSRHTHHHKDFGTKDDGAFTNFVWPRRFFVSLLPFAGIANFNDYRIHSDTRFSKSQFLSLTIGNMYSLGVGWFMFERTGLLFAVLVLVVIGPWIAFLLDRLRETTEHNLMSLETENGARNLGLGFWGLLVGGGPWGQPCHLSHHLIPALPWYQQCRLHFKLRSMMTRDQRRYFCIQPVVGFPRLLLHVLGVNLRYARDFMTGQNDRAVGDGT